MNNKNNDKNRIEEKKNNNFTITNPETLDAMAEVHQKILNKEPGYTDIDELWKAMYED